MAQEIILLMIKVEGQLLADPELVTKFIPNFMQARLSIPRGNGKGNELITVQAYGELMNILGQYSKSDTLMAMGPGFSSAWKNGGDKPCSGITIIAEDIR